MFDQTTYHEDMKMIRSALFALLMTGTALAQNCQPTITQRTTLNRGLFCSTITYCYEICNPTNCVLPIQKFCIDFPCGVDQLDAGSMTQPPNWAGVVDPVANEVCWSATARSSQIQPGQCRTFCITTNCNPRCIEGIQTATFWAEFNVLIRNNVQTSFVLANNPHRNFLAGESYASVGQPYILTATNATDPRGADFVFVGPFSLAAGMHLPGLGELYIDPILLLPLGPVQLDPLGHGQLPLPIPADPSLVGATLAFQSVAMSTGAPHLSGDKVVTVR